MFLRIHKSFFSRLAKNTKAVPKIVGMSDGSLIEKTLNRIHRSKYRNHHYHYEPKLDITKVPLSLHGTADVVSSSEVLEHVVPPDHLVFTGLRQLIKKNGVFVLSLPHNNSSGKLIAHFPELLLDDVP